MKILDGFDYRTGQPVRLSAAQWHEAAKGLHRRAVGGEVGFYDARGLLAMECYDHVPVRKGEAKMLIVPHTIENDIGANPWD